MFILVFMRWSTSKLKKYNVIKLPEKRIILHVGHQGPEKRHLQTIAERETINQ